MNSRKLIALNIFILSIAIYIFGFFINPKLHFDFKKLINFNKSDLDNKLNLVNIKKETTPTPEPTPLPLPKTISIPRLDIETDIIEVGVDENGAMQVPEDAFKIGWYMGSPTPGASGSAILTAHYDTPTGAPAIFYNLKKLQVGDQIIIKNSIGHTLYFSVEEVGQFPITEFPADFLYSKKPWAQISLITCTGVFNPSTGLYSHRLNINAKLEKVEELVYFADNSEKQSIYFSNLLDFSFSLAKKNILPPYIRLEETGEVVSVYLATGNKEVNELDLYLEYDPTTLSIIDDQTSYSQQFQVHGFRQDKNGRIFITLFNMSENKRINTKNKELKIVEFKINKITDFAEIKINKDQSRILGTNGFLDFSAGNVVY